MVVHCMYCSCPPCKDVCTVEAITKRDDGIILIDLPPKTGPGKLLVK
ncbi:4Fe-4S dicluster domain-containing protein [Chloroflexota bacterium]